MTFINFVIDQMNDDNYEVWGIKAGYHPPSFHNKGSETWRIDHDWLWYTFGIIRPVLERGYDPIPLTKAERKALAKVYFERWNIEKVREKDRKKRLRDWPA